MQFAVKLDRKSLCIVLITEKPELRMENCKLYNIHCSFLSYDIRNSRAHLEVNLILLSPFGRVRFELKHFFRSCIAM